MSMVIVTATMHPAEEFAKLDTVDSWLKTQEVPVAFRVIDNSVENRGLLASYQEAYTDTTEDIIAHIHDDVSIYEPGWADRVLKEFEDPTVGIVGFGGALRHGTRDLYKRPYQLTQLARDGYLSNTTDAEFHGRRFGGACDVAVLDGFSLIVRRELLDRCGGWKPDEWPPHHLYDYRICAEAHRHGYRVRLVGISCQHHGGRTATTPAYMQWAEQTKWGSDANMHRIGHRMFWEQYADVMPWRCA